MHILEKLYDCAETHLVGDNYNWAAFCGEFCAGFQSNMVLYRITFDDQRLPLEFETIITSMIDAAQEYKDRKLYAVQPITESDMAPLEPILRSEHMTDKQFKSMDIFSDFCRRYGYFYQLAVPATLSDGSILVLVAWRDETKSDFEKADKQRLALFMRHLLAKVQFRKLLNIKENTQVDKFGKKNGLTKTETEILSALLDGHSLRTIASNTKRTYGTTRWHVQNILSKCNVNNQKTLMKEFYQLIQV